MKLNAVLASAGLCAALAAFPFTASAKLDSCEGPITLGTTISLTGPFSTQAGPWGKMTQDFAKAINADGGIPIKSCHKKIPIKFVIYDDQSVPANAVSLYEKMATVDKVDFFVGPDWSSMGFPVGPVAEKHKIPIVMANVSTPKVYERGLKWVFGTPYPEVSLWSKQYFDMLAHMNPRPKTIFFVTEDNPVTKAISGVWTKKAEAAGMKLVGNMTFPPTLKDFTAIVLRMQAARPDVIYISSFDVASLPLVQQMRQLKVHAMDVHHALISGSLQKQVDIEGMTGELPWYPGVKGPYSDLVTKVIKESGSDPFQYVFTMARIASYLVMVQAIEKAGAVDREKVREALYMGHFKAPMGPVVFDKNGYPESNGAFTLQIQHGKVVIVWPPDKATGKPIWPSPSWQ
ncbi:MAG TPA: amino acid ABC transporter substrate-binding protein [Burkholderiales bacterium]|nr:amino acid ABC transporter substrate-binding protein [Burkholderiales bacterium]